MMGDRCTDMEKLKLDLSAVSEKYDKQVIVDALSVCANYHPLLLAEMVSFGAGEQLTVREDLRPEQFTGIFSKQFGESITSSIKQVCEIFATGAIGVTATASLVTNSAGGLNPMFLAAGAVSGVLVGINILRLSVQKNNNKFSKFSNLQKALKIVINNTPTITYALTVMKNGSEGEKKFIEGELPNLLKEATEQMRENTHLNNPSNQLQSAKTIPAITANNNSEPLPLINTHNIIQDALPGNN